MVFYLMFLLLTAKYNHDFEHWNEDEFELHPFIDYFFNFHDHDDSLLNAVIPMYSTLNGFFKYCFKSGGHNSTYEPQCVIVGKTIYNTLVIEQFIVKEKKNKKLSKELDEGYTKMANFFNNPSEDTFSIMTTQCFKFAQKEKNNEVEDFNRMNLILHTFCSYLTQKSTIPLQKLAREYEQRRGEDVNFWRKKALDAIENMKSYPMFAKIIPKDDQSYLYD